MPKAADLPDDDFVDELRRKYVWWQPVGAGTHAPERVIAQAMNVGTYEDLRRIERRLGAEKLLAVLTHAEPGWFSARSWDFWRGRLAQDCAANVPEAPPVRRFNAREL